MLTLAALENPVELLGAQYAQRALLAVLVLALLSAAIGWAIVLRELPFFTHAVGAGAYPVVVIGVVVGVGVALSALAGAIVFALLLALLTGRKSQGGGAIRSDRRDAMIGLLVAAALALGAVIASSAEGAAQIAASPEALLFGSLLAIDTSSLAVIVVVALAATAISAICFERWLARGFDPSSGRSDEVGRSELLLLAVVALAVAAALPVAGSLLAGALLIVPAATVRLFTDRARQLPLWTLILAAIEGTLGLYLSLGFDLPTGATIAGLAGAVFFLAAGARALTERHGSGLRATGLAASAVLMLLVLSGCGGGGSGTRSADDDSPLRVVATTPQVADIVNEVGGDAVKVTTLLPAGADPHGFEPRPSALAALAEAELIFRSGGAIDSWLTGAVSASGTEKTPVDLSRSAVLLNSPGSDEINPHWYLAPQNVARAAQKVRDELIKADPPARETFRAAADDYLGRIERVGDELVQCVNRTDRNRRGLLSGHDDFDYLADAVGLKIVARLKSSAAAEPSARELQKVVDRARSAGAQALVAGRDEVTQLERAVAEKLSIPLLALYSDSITTGDDGSTLLGAIGYDVDRIVAAISDGAVDCPPAQ